MRAGHVVGMPGVSQSVRGLLVLGLVCGLASPAPAGSIDTDFLEAPWPKQSVREYEVDKYPVQWRQKASRKEGIFAGANFLAPAPLQRSWTLGTQYTDLGKKLPQVTAIRVIEQTPTRQVVQIDMKVLWKAVTLAFEVEQEPPEAVRFRLQNPNFGEYRGLCRMSPEGQATRIVLATWLKPALRVPSGLILWVERLVLLEGIRNFLETCEEPPSAPAT